MKKLLLIGLFCIVNIETIHADDSLTIEKNIHYGQVIFRKKLQRKCGYTATYFAQQHTKKEWESFKNNGTLKEEFMQICPKGAKIVKDKWMTPLYLFAKEYAKDTDKHPKC